MNTKTNRTLVTYVRKYYIYSIFMAGWIFFRVACERLSVPNNLQYIADTIIQLGMFSVIIVLTIGMNKSYFTEQQKKNKQYRQYEHAISNGEFEIYLQPKYSISNGTITGAEALVRWNKPGRGIVPPDEFIPFFEESGLIVKLDKYMWENTAKMIADWKAIGKRIIPISVNISRVHTLGMPLCVTFLHIIKKYDISPEYLQLEFTESAHIEDIDSLYQTMSLLRKYGFTILIDDFGTGYSSLNMLKDCPADIIKTDKEFLKTIERNNLPASGCKSETIMQYVISMIHALGLGVVAEGVENEAHVHILQNCGCNIAQGYYYSPPVPRTDFEKIAFKQE